MHQFGARSFEFNLNTGRGTLLPSALPTNTEPLRTDKLRKAIANSGFELLNLDLEVFGKLQVQAGSNGKDQFLIETQTQAGSNRPTQRFLLIPGNTNLEQKAWSRLLPQLKPNSQTLRVRGRVHDHKNNPTALQVNNFQFFNKN